MAQLGGGIADIIAAAYDLDRTIFAGKRMGFRFRRRLSIIPGLWLNLSKSGLSGSIGGHGLTLNLSRRGRRTTIGLPGTGLSYRSPTQPWTRGETDQAHQQDADAVLPAPSSSSAQARSVPVGVVIIVVAMAFVLGLIAAGKL